LTYLSEMTEQSGPGPAEPQSGDDERPTASPVIRAVDRRQQRRWVPLTAGLISFVIGIAYIVEGVSPGYQHRLHNFDYLGSLTRTADLIIGLLLLMVSHGLRRRKRRAWEAAIILLATGFVVHSVLGLILRHFIPHISRPAIRPTTAVVTAVVLVAFIWFRREFYAVGDRRSRWRALWVLGYLIVADILIGLAYLAASRDGLAGHYTVSERVYTVVVNLVGFSGPVVFTSRTSADHFYFVTSGLGIFTLLVAVFMFLRPATRASRMATSDAAGIRELLSRYGEQDSLGYFALRYDKNVIWSPSGKSCITYRVLSGVMLASGDPLGDPEAWPGAIHTFLDEAASHAWVPAVMGCSELGAQVWCREGDLTALELGDEAVVNVAEFTLQGRAMRNVRQMNTRVCKEGYTAQLRRVEDISREEVARINRQADSWRGSPIERGWSMALGRVGGREDGRCVVATASQEGEMRALLHFVPWGDDGLSLDLMRRDRSAKPGLNDFMIVEAIKHAPDLGVKRISLNFAVFRAALERGERIGAGPVLRAWRGFLVFLSRWFQIESLYKFNAKFNPEWVPRFVVFPGTRDALRVGLAALEAEAFVVWPTFEVHRIARRLGLGRMRRWMHELGQERKAREAERLARRG
jgi:lysyl-tRNA synthetase, class II